MKTILLSLMLFCSFAIVRAQNVVLNEIYGNPGGSNSEFIELYNSTGAGSMDCYTIMSYYENELGSTKGWYVLDLPNTPNISSAPGFYVLAPVTPFSVQGTTGALADVNWNSLSFRNGSTNGYLKQFEWNGTGYTDKNLPDGTSVTNLLDGTLNGSQYYFVLLFKNGALINGFFGGPATGKLSDLANLGVPLGSLTVPLSGACSVSSFTVNFATLPSVEYWNPAGGNDNGYARKNDGKCGSWFKTAQQGDHTPGTSNGSATNLAGSLTTAATFNCGEAYGDPYARVTSNITGFSGVVNFADDFPVEVSLYYDVNHDQVLDGGDIQHPTIKIVSDTAVATVDTFHVIQNPAQLSWSFIIAYRTKRGCFDKVVAFSVECATLPVKLMSFTADRNRSNVDLKWVTSIEENSKGFEVERKIGYGSWETIGFVDSKARNGNSSSPLSYEFLDVNTTKGISQYRLKEVDIDGKQAYSMIRSVRGESQKSNTIIYPNPSGDGKVNVVFEDASSIHDVSLIDVSGKTLKQWKGVTNNNIRIDNLNAGFYTVRIVNIETGEQVVEKFIVNKR
ncbi:MAG TPA: T9SS type A sorting domain-containing protein [Chitinophagaceae bacterium]|jgi:hypothetical protein|nr:T9SS type A sorting domain-containing protein [Chitinophagaceae bacterium]